MPAPSKTWVTINDTQVDADSPLDTTLVTGLRDDVIHVRETVYDPAIHTPAKAHVHNGTDSAQINLADIVKSNAVEIFDDFLLGTLYGWSVGSGGTLTFLAAGSNGVLSTTWSGGGRGGISTGAKPFILSGGNTLTFIAKWGPNTYTNPTAAGTFVGFANQDSPTRGFYFGASAGYWSCITNAASGMTTTVTTVAIAKQYFTFKIVATASSVLFYIDGTLVATHTTNITTENLGAFIFIQSNNAGDVSYIDYIQAYSSARV